MATIIISCLSEVENDVNSNQAVKNLRVTFHSFNVDSMTQIQDTNADWSNYKLHLSLSLNVINTSSDDAQSQGLEGKISLDTISEPHVSLPFKSFKVLGGESQIETARTELNSETHHKTIQYILTQYVNEDRIKTEIGLNLLYTIAGRDGSLSLPSLQQAIPTKGQLSEEKRNQWSQVLESGVFDN